MGWYPSFDRHCIAGNSWFEGKHMRKPQEKDPWSPLWFLKKPRKPPVFPWFSGSFLRLQWQRNHSLRSVGHGWRSDRVSSHHLEPCHGIPWESGRKPWKTGSFLVFFFSLIFFLLKNRETILCRFVVLCGLGGDFHAQLRQRESFASHWIALDHISFSQLETWNTFRFTLNLLIPFSHCPHIIIHT